MTISRVQGNKKGTSNTSPISLTLDSTPQNGNVLIAVIATRTDTGTATVNSVSQTGVTWTQQVGKLYGTYHMNVEIWFGVVGSGAGKDIMINLSADPVDGGVADVCEYSGVATSNFLDKTATNYGSSTNPDTGTTAQTTQAGELWIGGTAVKSSIDQTSPKNGFTLLDGSYFNMMCSAYLEKIVSSTGQANSGTSISGTNQWVGCIATFFAATGGYTKDISEDPATVGICAGGASLTETATTTGQQASASISLMALQSYSYVPTIPLIQVSPEDSISPCAQSLILTSIQSITYTVTIPLLEESTETGTPAAISVTLPSEMSIESFTYVVTIPLLEAASELGQLSARSLMELTVESFTYAVSGISHLIFITDYEFDRINITRKEFSRINITQNEFSRINITCEERD